MNLNQNTLSTGLKLLICAAFATAITSVSMQSVVHALGQAQNGGLVVVKQVPAPTVHVITVAQAS